MKRAYIFALGLVIFARFPTSATIINIPGDYPTIQQGIDASTDGDTVLVQPGTYVENINFNGHNIVLGSLFLTTGDTSYISQTIIDGDSSGSVVTFESEEDSTAVIIGFTIRNGFVVTFGAGIYCTSSSPTIINNIIRDNVARTGWGGSGGGGIYAGPHSHPLISKNTIMGNQVTASSFPSYSAGGGIFCDSSSARIIQNTIIRNFAGAETDYGGGIACFYSNPVIENNIIGRNDAREGAGICVAASVLTIRNNTVVGNSGWYGGGLSCIMMDSLTVTNTILWGNAGPEGPEIFYDGTEPVVEYCDISGGWEGDGNIDADPMFIDPSVGNYNVYSESPCINAGDPDMNDPDGSRSDIGVFYPEHPDLSFEKWYVSTSGNHEGGDGSPQNPFRTIQHAIDISTTFDTVIVLNGDYEENVYFYYNNIVVASNYIYSGDSLDIQNTVIDGRSESTVVTFEICDSATVLEGFTITNGYNTIGGGISCISSDPLIESNIITGNNAHHAGLGGDGGGISCRYSNPIIRGNEISGNFASGYGSNGGGIYCWRSSPTISNNIIGDNQSTGSGGGIYCHFDSRLRIIRNIIYANSASAGGGINCGWDTRSSIINNCLAENSAGTSGGGIYCNVNSSSIIVNNILWGDDGPEGPEVYVQYGAELTILYCDISGGWEGEGNIDVDPLFRDPENGDFHLMADSCGDVYNSPCIDAGDPAIFDSILGCDWGLGTERSDMGAYGGQAIPTDIREEHPLSLPIACGLSQNYPNPFNASTIIQYSLPSPSDVIIDIYDILGRKVETLVQQEQPAGYHQVVWDAKDKSSGMYFYRIQAGEYAETKKMVLLK